MLTVILTPQGGTKKIMVVDIPQGIYHIYNVSYGDFSTRLHSLFIQIYSLLQIYLIHLAQRCLKLQLYFRKTLMRSRLPAPQI